MKASIRIALQLLAGSAVVACPGNLYAQTASDAAAVGDDTSTINDIVVTARRRNESIQETPIAMTALSMAQLEAKVTPNIGDLQGAAPNVLITQQNSGASASNVSIRGLSFADVDKSFDPTVGIVVDGVFIGTSTGSYLDFFDIASIEVLRGPQGTLYGRNTIGGVINIRRTRPTGEFGGKFEANYGSYNTWSTRAVVNAPIVDGILAAKAFYFHAQTDGYYRQGITGQRFGGSNNENFGASFLLTPSDKFDALLTLEKQVQDFQPYNSNISKTGEVFCVLEPANECNRPTSGDALYTVFGSAGYSHYRSPAVTLEMNGDLGAIKLTSITSYRTSKESQAQDFDSSSADIYYSQRQQKYRQFSQEIRGAGKISDTLDYVVGGFYFKSRYSLDQLTQITLFAPTAVTEQRTTGHAESYAVFGDFDWSFADRWRLSFGGRWTHDQKQNENGVDAAQYPNVTYNSSKFTPKIGVDFRPSDQLMVYGSWSRGYRSGGFSGRGTTLVSSTTPYGPETVDSYEVGFKSSLFDRKLLFNLAAFYADYNSLQQNTTVPAPNGVGSETIVTNVGSATIKGIELDITAKPVPRLTINGSLGYLKSHFNDFISQGAVSATVPAARTIDYSNVRMIYSPKITASANATYAVPTSFGELKANLSYRYLSPYDQQIALDATATYPATGVIVVPRNDPRLRSDRQNLLDASVTAEFDLAGTKAHATAFVRNLLDDRGPNAAFTVAGLWAFSSAREPRVWGGQIGFEF